MLLLQNSMNLVEVVPYSYTETFRSGNQVIDTKVEDVTDVQEDKHPVVELLQVIKAEQEVCLMQYSSNESEFHFM
jgi:hypothetical protein